MDSISLVIGTIIGTGIFIKAAIMTQQAGSPGWVLLAWVAAGILSLTGALAYAELGALFPKAGGEYVFLKEGYGNLLAFLYGWMRFWIASPGSIAAYAVGAATFAARVYPLDSLGGKSAVAIALVAIFTALNCLTVKFGGHIQSFMTALKIGMIAILIFGIFGFSETGTLENFSYSSPWPGFSAFGAAMLAALWAFDGWNNLPMVAGEIERPSRNIPLALGLGTFIILIIYGLTNVAYFYALTPTQVAESYSSLHPNALPVGTIAATTFLGDFGVILLSIAFVLSAVGAMNGSILSSARVPFAMARDGLFIKWLGQVHPKTRSPITALIIQGIWASALALSGSFDQLTDYVVFASWIFYALVTASLFIFRKKLAHIERPYKAWGYPILPSLFLITSVLLLINTLITSTEASLKGLVLICIGIPVYYIFYRNTGVK
ncbi:MAG: APC family permease [Pseudobdellovibrionaceae bacterium]